MFAISLTYVQDHGVTATEGIMTSPGISFTQAEALGGDGDVVPNTQTAGAPINVTITMSCADQNDSDLPSRVGAESTAMVGWL